MSRRNIFLLMMFLGVLSCMQDAEARGGGGRGGGGGGGRGGGGRGGYSGGGRNLSRAPTMSRAGADRDRAAFQPRQMSGGDFQTRSNAQLQQFMGEGRSNFADRNLGAASQSLKNVNPNLRSDIGNRQNIANNVRGDWNRGDWNRNNLFNNDFWRDHHYNPVYGNFWRGAAWGAAAGWLGYGWDYPYYYDNGYGVPVSSSGDTSYLYTQEDQVTTPPPQSAPAEGQASSNRLPLGVYTLKSDQASSSDPTMYLQLALGKDGTLAGSYFNSATDQVSPVTGIVDKASQRAVWKVSNVDGAPIFDTGLFNLTKDNTPVSVTFSDGSEQTWLMIKATDG